MKLLLRLKCVEGCRVMERLYLHLCLLGSMVAYIAKSRPNASYEPQVMTATDGIGMITDI